MTASTLAVRKGRAFVSRDHPGRLWSLLEIMNVFRVDQLIHCLGMLDTLQDEFEEMKRCAIDPRDPPAFFYSEALKHVKRALWCASVPGFEHSRKKIEISLIHMDNDERELQMDAPSLMTELRNIIESLHADIARHHFVSIPDALFSYFNAPALLGNEVAAAFPSAAFDIREAGNCLASDCNTAAVFHLMRAVEWGLRALAADLGLLKIARRRKRGSPAKYVPLAYSDWEHILTQLQTKVDAKMAALTPSKRKQDLQEFYYPALQDIRGMRDAWRNHVMHTRREYTGKDADAILDHVRRLMVTLATRVKEI